MPDIDIDFANRDEVLGKIKHRVAALGNGKKHNTGVYATEIPHSPFTNISTIDYKSADQRGYFKIDFLNVSIYENVRDEEHLIQLMNTEPMWELLEHDEFVDQVFHLSTHGDLLRQMKPDSIEKLAAVLAMIRPAKRYLVGEPWDKVLKEVWQKPTNEDYYFKHSHAVSYAVAVVVHMNLLCEEFKT